MSQLMFNSGRFLIARRPCSRASRAVAWLNRSWRGVECGRKSKPKVVEYQAARRDANGNDTPHMLLSFPYRDFAREGAWRSPSLKR